MLRLADGPRFATRSAIALAAALVAAVVLCVPASAGTQDGSRRFDASTWLVPDATVGAPAARDDRRNADAPADFGRWEGRRGVTSWIDVLLTAVSGDRVNPPRASRALALTSVAINDALALADRGRHRERGRPASCRRRSRPGVARCIADRRLPTTAVAAGAAAVVLRELLPNRAGELDRLEQEALRSLLLAGAARPLQVRAGLALGRAVGELAVRRARNDRSDTQGPVVPPPGDATWVPTPPAFAPPLEPFAGTWRPWNLRSGDELRPSAPPRYLGRVHRAAIQEVYEVARTLTERQREIALFWDDGAGSETPPGHWNRIALELIERARLSPQQAAFALAVLNTTQADAFIACWNAKFTYWTKRPVTLIRELLDPEYLSLIPTPPFPSYPSGHSTTSGAAATVLGALFPNSARELAAMADEAAISRLYGGIHYRFDNDAGLDLGRRIGALTLKRLYR
jgi:hypothetical protein